MKAWETKELNPMAIRVVPVETDHCLAGAEAASLFDSAGKESESAVVTAASSDLVEDVVLVGTCCC